VKTISIKKRLALGTVVAVAAGLLTTVSATTANAALSVNLLSYTGGAVTAQDNLSSGAPAKGVASSGLVESTFVAQTSTNGAATGVMLASGRLSLTIVGPTTVSATDVRDTIVVTGGAILDSSGGGTNGAVVAINTDGTRADLVTTATSSAGDTYSFLIAPTVAAGGTITIQRFTGITLGAAAAFSTAGALNFNGAISVVAAATTGVSTAKSWAYLLAPNTAATFPSAGDQATPTGTTWVSTGWNGTTTSPATWDQVKGFIVPNGNVAGIQFAIHDAYGNAAAAANGFLSITSDNCYVALGSNYSTSKSYYSSSDSGDAATAARVVSVINATANTATTCATTISFNGSVIATKSIKFLGDIASVTAVTAGTASTTDSLNVGSKLLSVTYKDAAGNVVPGSDAAVDSGSNAYVTTIRTTTNYKNSDYARWAAGKSGLYDWACGGVAGSASFVLKTTNAAGATIKSAPVTLKCSAAPYTYAIKMDKDTYATGDIATVTITFKSSDGSVPNDVTVFGPTANSVSSGAFATSNSGYVTAPSGTADTSTDGVLTYKMVIGQTAGSFPVVVSVPSLNANGVATDQTATIKVTAAAAAANPDITALVNVVGTLLTSFTKQISALIKALSKKK